MNTYKITNITNLSNKREFKHNSPLDITYVDNLATKKVTIKAGESIYLKVKSLPMSVRKLRVENLVTVVEVSDAEIASILNSKQNLKSPAITKSVEVEAQTKPRSRGSKKQK